MQENSEETKEASAENLRVKELEGKVVGFDYEPSDEPVKEVVFFGDTERAIGPSTALKNQYDKMEIRNSPLEGYGVFSTADIEGGSVLEEIPFVVWNRSMEVSEDVLQVIQQKGFMSENEIRNDQVRQMFGHKHPKKYYFKWFPPNTPRDGDNPLYFQCLPLGYGPIYNSSNGKNNASWEVKDKTFIFKATQKIPANREICTFYGYFCSEEDQTWQTPEVFGLAMEYLATEDGGKEVFLTNVRFSGQKEQELRLKEEGTKQLIECLRKSQGKIKLNKLSVLDGGKETHSFEFPKDFGLGWTFRKLQEFKQTRFAVVKIYLSYLDLETKKEVKKEILWVNHNVLG